MADNVDITPGTGATVAADELSINATTVKVQRVKVAVGKDGTYTGDQAGRNVDGDANASAAFVDQRSLVVRSQITPTISTSPAYTAKDAVGGLMTFTNMARAAGGSCLIQSVQVVDLSQQRSGIDLVLFDRSIGAPTDNAVFDPSDADLLFCVGVVPISVGAYADLNDNSVAAVNSVGLEVVLNGTSLYGVLVARSTPTYAGTSDIVVTLTAIVG